MLIFLQVILIAISAGGAGSLISNIALHYAPSYQPRWMTIWQAAGVSLFVGAYIGLFWSKLFGA